METFKTRKTLGSLYLYLYLFFFSSKKILFPLFWTHVWIYFLNCTVQATFFISRLSNIFELAGHATFSSYLTAILSEPKVNLTSTFTISQKKLCRYFRVILWFTGFWFCMKVTWILTLSSAARSLVLNIFRFFQDFPKILKSPFLHRYSSCRTGL